MRTEKSYFSSIVYESDFAEYYIGEKDLITVEYILISYSRKLQL